MDGLMEQWFERPLLPPEWVRREFTEGKISDSLINTHTHTHTLSNTRRLKCLHMLLARACKRTNICMKTHAHTYKHVHTRFKLPTHRYPLLPIEGFTLISWDQNLQIPPLRIEMYCWTRPPSSMLGPMAHTHTHTHTHIHGWINLRGSLRAKKKKKKSSCSSPPLCSMHSVSWSVCSAVIWSVTN